MTDTAAIHLIIRRHGDVNVVDVALADERPSSLGRVFASLLPGVHW